MLFLLCILDEGNSILHKDISQLERATFSSKKYLLDCKEGLLMRGWLCWEPCSLNETTYPNLFINEGLALLGTM